MWAAACPARLQLAPPRATGARRGLRQRRPASRRAPRPGPRPAPIRASGQGGEASAGGCGWVPPPLPAFEFAANEAQRLGHDSITTVHLLLGILQTDGGRPMPLSARQSRGSTAPQSSCNWLNATVVRLAPPMQALRPGCWGSMESSWRRHALPCSLCAQGALRSMQCLLWTEMLRELWKWPRSYRQGVSGRLLCSYKSVCAALLPGNCPPARCWLAAVAACGPAPAKAAFSSCRCRAALRHPAPSGRSPLG